MGLVLLESGIQQNWYILNTVFRVGFTEKLMPEQAWRGLWELVMKIARRVALLPGLRQGPL